MKLRLVKLLSTSLYLLSFGFIFLFNLGTAFSEEQEDSYQIRIVNKENISFLSPVLRLPDKSRVEEGILSISLSTPMSKARLLKSLFDQRKEQLSKQPSIIFTEINSLQGFYKNSYVKNNFEIDVELSLFRSGKLIKGLIRLYKSDSDTPGLEILEIPPSNESTLGKYVFAQNSADSNQSPLTILSPVTKKCREIPAEGKGDPILLSGMSISDIFFRFSAEGLFDYKNVSREELLVPESKLVRDSELADGIHIVHDIDKYALKEVQLISAQALSSLYARSTSLIHIDLKNGLPYQMQFLMEGTNKKAVFLYSWIQLEDGTSLPREISYYEDKGSGSYEIVSRLDTVNIRRQKTGQKAFKEELAKLCTGQ